jgi:hypothetical protein
VKIGFADNLPKTMELRDTFGNVTMLTFGRFERNPAIDPAQFKFVPPKARTWSARPNRSGQRDALVRRRLTQPVRVIADQPSTFMSMSRAMSMGLFTVHGSTLMPSACASAIDSAVTLRQNGDHVPHRRPSEARQRSAVRGEVEPACHGEGDRICAERCPCCPTRCETDRFDLRRELLRLHERAPVERLDRRALRQSCRLDGVDDELAKVSASTVSSGFPV